MLIELITPGGIGPEDAILHISCEIGHGLLIVSECEDNQ